MNKDIKAFSLGGKNGDRPMIVQAPKLAAVAENAPSVEPESLTERPGPLRKLKAKSGSR